MTSETVTNRPRSRALTLVSGTVCDNPPRLPQRRRFRLTNARSCRRELASVYADMRTGVLPVEIGVKLAYVIGQLVRVMTDAEFESRLVALEAAAKKVGTL